METDPFLNKTRTTTWVLHTDPLLSTLATTIDKSILIYITHTIPHITIQTNHFTDSALYNIATLLILPINKLFYLLLLLPTASMLGPSKTIAYSTGTIDVYTQCTQNDTYTQCPLLEELKQIQGTYSQHSKNKTNMEIYFHRIVIYCITHTALRIANGFKFGTYIKHLFDETKI